MGLVDGREGRRGRLSCLAFHRERRDDVVRQLVEDVERLEGCDRRHAAGLRLDDEDLHPQLGFVNAHGKLEAGAFVDFLGCEWARDEVAAFESTEDPLSPSTHNRVASP